MDTPTPAPAAGERLNEDRLRNWVRVQERQSPGTANTRALTDLLALVDKQAGELADVKGRQFNKRVDRLNVVWGEKLKAGAETARATALEDCAQACRQEISRARNLAAQLVTNGASEGTIVAAEMVTMGREDSASKILAAIRSLTAPAVEKE